MPARIDIKLGTKFGRLKVIGEAPTRRTPGGFEKRYLLCECSCGKIGDYMMNHLRTGKTKSCGCYRSDRARAALGEKSSQWKGGMNYKAKIRASNEYKRWRKECFERDNYTCQISGQVGGQLNVHHLLPFALEIDDLDCDFRSSLDLFDISKGITISEDLHKRFHKLYGQTGFSLEDFEEFRVIVGSDGTV